MANRCRGSLLVALWLGVIGCNGKASKVEAPKAEAEADANEQPRRARVEKPVEERAKPTREREVPPEEELTDIGMEVDIPSGVPGGVPGGVVGGVIGGIEGGIAGELPPPPPPPEKKPLEVHNVALDKISGDPEILPPKRVRAKMARKGEKRIEANLEMCLSKKGEVTRLEVKRSSGYRAYDHVIMEDLWRWKYEPFVYDGEPVPVCTLIAIVYVSGAKKQP